MTDDQKKKDLTDLFSLEDPIMPTDAGVSSEGSSQFVTTAPSEAASPIEGFTGLIEPQPLPSGEEPAILEDPLASLPPIDADVYAMATGGNSDAPSEIEAPAMLGTGAIEAKTLDDLGEGLLEPPSDALLAASDSPDDAESESITAASPLTETHPETLPETLPALGGDLESLEGKTESAPPAVKAIQAGMEEIKKFSERVAPTERLHVAAGIPYSLLIEGRLKVHERERLASIVTRDLGMREVDLEPQFEANKVLIPRISEYAGIAIVQALRGARVRMRLGPSEQIFTSKDSRDDDGLLLPTDPIEYSTTESGAHPADLVTISPENTLGGKKNFDLVDTIHASMNVKASHVHSPTSSLFQESLDALKRQLKFRAHHRGANAIIGFTTQMIPIADHTQYKLIAQGTAVRTK